MKISRVTPWIIERRRRRARRAAPGAGPARAPRQYVFVQVDTDEGITGWGEITTYPGVANRAVCAVLRELAPCLAAQDPSRIEAIWHKLFRAFTYMGTRGATTAVVSGIDIALWDIRGKALGLPIYELLGGTVRETVPLYTHFPLRRDRRGGGRKRARPGRRRRRAIKTDPFAKWGPRGTRLPGRAASVAAERAAGVDIIAADPRGGRARRRDLDRRPRASTTCPPRSASPTAWRRTRSAGSRSRSRPRATTR